MMRIKWNRHLDGSSSRRLEDETGTQEADEKKSSKNSSPSIFKIFRRKKSRRRDEDDSKNKGSNGSVPPLQCEADEDDTASVSSVATCASQPVTEGFQRERASSLFSSFRLSLPGSKRKKRKVAPTPSETVLNGEDNEPQMERYSTPDLRKTSDKLVSPNNVQTNLCTSSPSIRTKESSISAQSLIRKNSDSFDKLKWSNLKSATTSGSKLSKSVSFSDCGDSLIDSSHSKFDNKVLRAVNSKPMVEEDSEALESESSICMSDNPHMSHESKSATAADSPSSFLNVQSFQKDILDAGCVCVTTNIGILSVDDANNSSGTGHSSNDVAPEVELIDKTNIDDKFHNKKIILHENSLSSFVNCDTNELATENIDEKNDKLIFCDNSKESYVEQFIKTETDDSSVLEQNSEKHDDNRNILLYSPENDTVNEHLTLDKSDVNSISLNKKLKVLSTELCGLTAVQGNTSSKCKDVNISTSDMKNDFFSNEQSNYKASKIERSQLDENSFPGSKHVLCHMRVYEDESVEQKLENSVKVNDNQLNSEKPLTKSPEATRNLENHCEKETSPNKSVLEAILIDKNVDISSSNLKSSYELKNNYSPSLYNQDFNESCALSLCCDKNICDQKVPECDIHAYHNFQSDQKVPEFELSLLEFEEVCSKYMSQNKPEFSEYDSTVPLYSNSPKQKSVLDMNLAFVYPTLHVNDNNKIYLGNKEADCASPSFNDTVKQNIKMSNHSHFQDSCHISAEKSFLPSPPKQWINYEKSTNDDFNHDVCIDRVQCTNVRGKNLCQEPYLESIPTTVMLSDSDLEGIDTPQLSSTPQAFEIKSGRDHSSGVTSEEHLSDDSTLREDMVSNVGVTISSLNGVLDYSFASETPEKASVYLDSQIRDTYRGPRAICDPLVYSTDVAKRFESLVPENYLNGHNFCDKRSLGLSDVISDYISPGKGLIEISNPYEEDTFLLPGDLSNRQFTKNVSCLYSDNNTTCTTVKVDSDSCSNLKISTNISDGNSNSETSESKEVISAVDGNNTEKQMSNYNVSGICTEKVKQPLTNEKEHRKDKKPKNVEQKNAINKNKNSMIPCRTKGYSDVEIKRNETKLKTKKSNSLPRFNKSESHLPIKNTNSHRMFSNSCKDSVADHQHGKNKDFSVSKTGGIISNNSSCDISVVLHEYDSNLQIEKSTILVDPGCHVANEYNKIPSECSDSIFESSTCINEVPNLKSNNQSSFVINLKDNGISKNALNHSADDISSISVNKAKELTVSISSINSDEKFTSELCPTCLQLDQEHVDGFTDKMKYHYCSKHLDTTESLRRFSLPAVNLRKSSYTSSKESLSSQLTSSSYRGKSRIPRKQTSARGTPSKGPVRPPMWLSKAELTQEIQRLGTLCEARTKELNRLKMETKHVSSGFDAFAALFKYMVEDLNGLSVPALTKDLEKTLKQLELTKQDLAFYEREVEEMKSHHCQELNDLSNKLFEVYQSEVAELNAKHQEEINHLKSEHQNQIEHLKTTYDESSTEAKAHHEKMIANLEQEIVNQREELQQYQERELKDLEEKHTESTKLLQEHIEQLQKKCAELKQHSMSMEDAMRKDTDSKLQWVSAAKLDLEKEVESLKAVLEMKNKELHTIRVQNLEMEKQLEELPFAREKIKMLQARAEDLEALMIEKTKLERKLSTENQQIKDTYEKEAKVNRRLSMENEELQWRLRQAENSIISGSFNEVPEFAEVEENIATSPTKSPGPQLLSRSVFFTFVDKDESSPHSPRSQYKKITPNFAANYKTSPAKSSKSPPVPSPRRGKSHSEPPQPPQSITSTSTPRKVAKQSLNKTKFSQKRQRSGSDSSRLSEPTEVNFSSVTESMTSSVSSESSVFEQQERLLEEHKEQIFHSLEILREQRSTESSVDEPTTMGKKWCSDDIKITGDLPNLEMEDMSRSAEFSDPKTYYHMTFPVLKESGVTDCDIEDSSGKNSDCGNSPVKEVLPNSIKHSTLENDMDVVEATGISQNMDMSFPEIRGRAVNVGNKRNSCTESTLTAENVQRKSSNCDKTDNRWRTI